MLCPFSLCEPRVCHRVASLEAAKTVSDRELATSRESLCEKEKELAALRDARAHDAAALEALRTQLKDSQDARSQLLRSKEELEADVLSRRGLVCELEQRLAAMQSRLAEAERKEAEGTAALRTMDENHKAKLKKMKEERDILVQDKLTLQAELSAARSRAQVCQHGLSHLLFDLVVQAQEQALADEIAHHKAATAYAVQEASQAKAALEKLVAEKNANAELHASLQETITHLQKQFDEEVCLCK